MRISLYMIDTNVYICGCVRNCATYLMKVFLNIDNISRLFNDFVIIVAHDFSTDNTIEILLQYQKKYGNKLKIINNTDTLSRIRTENISKARNSILREIRERNEPMFTHMIMMDLDDVCAEPINMEVIKQSMNRSDWDALSFNRPDYYDIWALSLEPYIYSCWHFHPKTEECVNIIKKYVSNKLNKLGNGELLECSSAFNGFAIYKLSAFKNCSYDWKLNNNVKLINKLYPNMIINNCKSLNKNAHLGEMYRDCSIGYNADCEHRKFHMSAILLNNSRIRISPLSLFL